MSCVCSHKFSEGRKQPNAVCVFDKKKKEKTVHLHLPTLMPVLMHSPLILHLNSLRICHAANLYNVAVERLKMNVHLSNLS